MDRNVSPADFDEVSVMAYVTCRMTPDELSVTLARTFESYFSEEVQSVAESAKADVQKEREFCNWAESEILDLQRRLKEITDTASTESFRSPLQSLTDYEDVEAVDSDTARRKAQELAAYVVRNLLSQRIKSAIAENLRPFVKAQSECRHRSKQLEHRRQYLMDELAAAEHIRDNPPAEDAKGDPVMEELLRRERAGEPLVSTA